MRQTNCPVPRTGDVARGEIRRSGIGDRHVLEFDDRVHVARIALVQSVSEEHHAKEAFLVDEKFVNAPSSVESGSENPSIVYLQEFSSGSSAAGERESLPAISIVWSHRPTRCISIRFSLVVERAMREARKIERCRVRAAFNEQVQILKAVAVTVASS